VRGAVGQKKIALAFTGHSFAEGGATFLGELGRRKAKASFFFTGEFLANTNFELLVRRIIAEGHYVGPHSDKHLLYCNWDKMEKTLVTRDDFRADLNANLQKIERFGVSRASVKFFLPPFEQYNPDVVAWSAEMGLTLINLTPGTRSNADYTGEAETNFVSSQAIFDSIVKRERDDPHGLNGFILLFHIGSGPGRADKFHARFGELLDYLSGKGYKFVHVDELLEPKQEHGNQKAD
jgi:peptidoglycan/xylan/chitin deacetylase (PgdA/CDA1 family)